MSKDLNQCNFIGRLGKDVDLRFTPSGSAVANFSIACSDDYKSKQGEKVEQTNWVSIVAFGKLGEICGKYLIKGSQVYISGKFNTEKWTDKQGNDRYTTKIIADNMQMLGGKGEGGQPAQKQASPSQPANNAPVDDNFDDDIPF